MTIAWAEHAAKRFQKRATSKWATPGAMAKDLDPKTIQTPALDLIDQALVEAYNTPDARVIISMPPQEGKSQRASRWFPLWALEQNHNLRVIVTSYEMGMARRHSRWVRNMILMHGGRLNMAIRHDLSSQHEWELAGSATEGGIIAAGLDGAITGRPGDMLIIDDPVKNRQAADSKTVRDNAWDFWTETASTRLSPGAPVVLILTRWHHDDLAGRLQAAEDGHLWKVINIPAQADHNPEHEDPDRRVDALDREPGEFMRSARLRTGKQWEAIKVRSGPRTWSSLYQGRPTADEGGLFPTEVWSRYDIPQHIVRADGAHVVLYGHEDVEMVQSWDMAFKDTKQSDYVVGQVWLRRGVHVYLLDQVRGRMNFNATVQAVLDLSAKWPQAVAKFIEDKANGPAIMNMLNTKVMGMIPIEPEGSKYARASAISPLVHSKNVHIPTAELAPWVGDFVQEHKDFPNGANDDQVDCDSQAVNRLLLLPLLDEQAAVRQAEEFEELDMRGYSISPY